MSQVSESGSPAAYRRHRDEGTKSGAVVISTANPALPIVHVLDGVAHWAGGKTHHDATTESLAAALIRAVNEWADANA